MCRALYERFFEGFAPWGEPNIPIDKPFMASPGFYQLLARLRRHAEQHARDHWVQCSGCGLWRIISWQQLAALKGGAGDWTCSMLRCAWPGLLCCVCDGLASSTWLYLLTAYF